MNKVSVIAYIMIAILGAFGLYYMFKGTASTGEGDWYFELNLAEEYAEKYQKCTYYPQENTVSCIYKEDKKPEGRDYEKIRKDVFVQPGIQPTGDTMHIYGWYQQKDPVSGKEKPTKYWVWKYTKEKK